MTIDLQLVDCLCPTTLCVVDDGVRAVASSGAIHVEMIAFCVTSASAVSIRPVRSSRDGGRRSDGRVHVLGPGVERARIW